MAQGAASRWVVRGTTPDERWTAYHLHPLGNAAGDHRALAMDRLVFAQNGGIRSVVMGR